MKSTIIFKRDNKNVKKPLHLKKWSVFIFYAARNLKIPSMQFERCNTEITLTLPKNSCGYFTSKFKQMKIEQVCGNKQRICIGILNRSLTEEVVIKKKISIHIFCFRNKRTY